MKITIHQPEHFPYIGFFQKMESADLFVILDDVQYTKNNFQNRNKFKNKNILLLANNFDGVSRLNLDKNARPQTKNMKKQIKFPVVYTRIHS